MKTTINGSRRGFTLLELLILMGVASVALAILLPSIGTARNSANRVKCMANIHQIELGMVMYCNDNKGYFPASAKQDKQYAEDFIYWQQPKTTWDKTLYTGEETRELDQSPLVKYMGQKFDSKQWTCPADDGKAHRKFKINDVELNYPYSYTMNSILSCELETQDPDAFAYLTKTARLFTVRRPDSTVLVVEESSLTINDGSTDLVGFDGPTLEKVTPGGKKGTDWLSTRHDASANQPENTATDEDTKKIPNTKARCNVGFCDGHVAAFSRGDAQDPALRHWDPTSTK